MEKLDQIIAAIRTLSSKQKLAVDMTKSYELRIKSLEAGTRRSQQLIQNQERIIRNQERTMRRLIGDLNSLEGDLANLKKRSEK